MQSIDVFQEIIATLCSEDERLAFPKGASRSQIEKLQAYLGQTLPKELRQIYLCHDGEPQPVCASPPIYLFLGHEFNSLERIAKKYRVFARAKEFTDPLGDFDVTDYVSVPPGAVQKVFWSPGWVPFAGWSAGCLAIDYEPGPDGVVGQIINFSRDDTVHYQIAPDFETFLQQVLQKYRERRWHCRFESKLWNSYDALATEHAKASGRS